MAGSQSWRAIKVKLDRYQMDTASNEANRYMANDEEKIYQSLGRLKSVSRVAGRLLRVLFYIYIVATLVIFAAIFLRIVSLDYSIGDILSTIQRFLPNLIMVAIATLLFRLFIRVFEDMSRGESPFSDMQSLRWKTVGWLLLGKMLFELMVSFAPFSIESVGDMLVGLSVQPIIVSVDVASVLWVIVSFCLSYVFKYGALLQRLSDETL